MAKKRCGKRSAKCGRKKQRSCDNVNGIDVTLNPDPANFNPDPANTVKEPTLQRLVELLAHCQDLNEIDFECPTAEDLNQWPPFIVEETWPNFTDMKRRTMLNDQGGLFPRRLPYVKGIHVCKMSQEGAYLCANLGSSPHYTIPPEQLHQFMEYVEDTGKEYHVYEPGSSYYGSDFFQIYNVNGESIESNGTVEWDQEVEWDQDMHQTAEDHKKAHSKRIQCEMAQRELLDKLPWKELAAKALKEGDFNSNRNAFQLFQGFASNQSQTRVKTGENQGHTYPNFQSDGSLNANSMITQTNVILSKIGDLLFENIRVENQPGFFDNSERQEKWAGHNRGFNHKEAKIEALAISIQSAGTPLRIHCDEHNDESEKGRSGNYHYTVCCWKTVVVEGILFRIAIIGYSRRSLSQADERHGVREALCEKIKAYHDSLPDCRKKVGPHLFVVGEKGDEAEEDDDGHIVRPINMKKDVYYSTFCDSLMKVSIHALFVQLIGLSRYFLRTLFSPLCFNLGY